MESTGAACEDVQEPAGRSLLDSYVPLRDTKGLILEQEEIYETLAKVHDAHARTHRKTIQVHKNAAADAIKQNDAAARLRGLETQERFANVLLKMCNSSLQNASLTVQVQDLIDSQGLQHPDEFQVLSVFPEHGRSALLDLSEEEWSSELADAFWKADNAHQRAMEECIAQLKTLLKDKENLQRAVQSLQQELHRRQQDEQVQKQRCYEVLTARDDKYDTDTRQLKEQLERSQTELLQQKQLVEVLQSRQEHDSAMQSVLQTLQNQTAGIAPTMQKTQERHEAIEKELQDSRSAYAEQVELMQGVHAQVAELDVELKRYKLNDVQELCEKERQETARVKEQLQASQKRALEASDADKAATQALQQEQTQCLRDLREQMTELQAKLHTSEAQFTDSEKEKAALREQLQVLQQEVQAARAAAGRADAAAEQERRFSAQKDWITQQLQPLLQQPRPAAADPVLQSAPVHAGAPAGGPAQTAAAGLGPAAASPTPLSSAAFMSEEDGDAADGAAAYADVGRLAQALSGRQGAGAAGAAAQALGTIAEASPAAEGEVANATQAEVPEKATKRRGRAAASKKAAGAAAAPAKPAKRKAPAKKAARAAAGAKQGKGKQEAQADEEDAHDGSSPVRSAAPPAQPRKRGRGGAAAAAEAAIVDGDAATHHEPAKPVDQDRAPAAGEGQGDDAGAGQVRRDRRVLRARKPGLTMAEDTDDSQASDGASEAGSCGNAGKAKRRRTSGAKQVDSVRGQAATAAMPRDAAPRDASTVASPLLEAPSFGSPQAMRIEDAQDLIQGRLDHAGDAGARGADAASPPARAPAGAAVAVWEDPDSSEVRVPARSRPALSERPNNGSEQNVLAGEASRRGTLGVHSVVSAQGHGHRAGSQVPNSLRDPETFGIVRNPMAAMTSKVMEATKVGRQKTAMSWGEKLAVKASERVRIGRPGARALGQNWSKNCVNAPSSELFPNGWKRQTLRQ